MSLDVLALCAPKSDQLNADDLISGSKIIEITRVSQGSSEQPININFIGDNGKPFKPCKSMIRVLIALYTEKADNWIGKRIQLYNDKSVIYGKVQVGGIRISHASDITTPLQVALTIRRGVKAMTKIEILPKIDVKPLQTLEIGTPNFDKCKAAILKGFSIADMRKKYLISAEVEALLTHKEPLNSEILNEKPE